MDKRAIVCKRILDDCADLLKGYHFPISKNKSLDNQNSMLKMLTLKNVRQLIDGKEITYSNIKYEPKYNKEIQYIKQFDIIIPTAVGQGNQFDVMYIENKLDDEYCYNDTVLVIRVREDVISSKYLYIQLKSKEIQDKLLDIAKGSTILHISKKDLSNIDIPIYEEEVMKQICKEYDKIQKNKKKIENDEQQFWNNLNK